MLTLELYPLPLPRPRTGKWIRAGHKVQVREMPQHYSAALTNRKCPLDRL
jgi:hypothetical protein